MSVHIAWGRLRILTSKYMIFAQGITMNRRKFITSIATLTSAQLLSIPSLTTAAPVTTLGPEAKRRAGKISTMPRLFCTAYITPNAPGQGNQEHLAAKYPLIIVPQDTSKQFVEWRDKVRQLNPDIIMLGYQVVIEETTVPGPGHDRIRELKKDIWSKYPDCSYPTVGPSYKQRRLVDPRDTDWENAFLEGCYRTLTSYDYDGLFLDQCDVFPIAHPQLEIRNEMRYALQSTLLKLRAIIPNSIIVGNTKNSWSGLNGEMNEARSDEILDELKQFAHHKKPVVELVQTRLSGNLDKNKIISDMALAHSKGAFYGAAYDYQHILWIDEFDEIINTQYK